MISVTSAIDLYRSQAQTGLVNTPAELPLKNATSGDETVDQAAESLVSISAAARSAAISAAARSAAANPFDESSI